LTAAATTPTAAGSSSPKSVKGGEHELCWDRVQPPEEDYIEMVSQFSVTIHRQLTCWSERMTQLWIMRKDSLSDRLLILIKRKSFSTIHSWNASTVCKDEKEMLARQGKILHSFKE
jgi:hypothetical protein